MSNNPIKVGFAWAQEFEFTAGFLQTSDILRAEFRREATDASQITSVTSAGVGVDIVENKVTLSLSEDQTDKFLKLAKAGEPTVTNLVIVRDGIEIPVPLIITIPVVLLPTRPA